MKKETYLKNRINNWFVNAKKDYNVKGQLININVFDKENKFGIKECTIYDITTIENGKIECYVIKDYNDTAEDLYNMWMEEYANAR